MKNIIMPKQESNTIVIPKPKQRLHWAPQSKVYADKRRKELNKKFVFKG